MAEDLPNAKQLLLTGSTQSHSYEIPDRLDYIKLPSITKSPDGVYSAGSLEVPFDTINSIRENMIFETVKYYKADLFLIDKAPAGIHGELMRSLQYLKSNHPKTKLVFGMRDIEDDPQVTRKTWEQNGVYSLLEEVYDTIFLYGSRTVYDPVQEYGLSENMGKKIISCGYIGRDLRSVRPVQNIRDSLKMKTDKLVVVTAGGGGDGFEMIDAYLEMLETAEKRSLSKFDSFVVTGPMMSEENKNRLKRHQVGGIPLTLIDFTPEMISYLNAADLVISMGGYNSFCEILSLHKRAIIIPRIVPRVEQLIRANRFSALGLIRMIHPDELAPERLLEEITTEIGRRNPVRPEDAGIQMNGASNASRAIGRLLNKADGP
ncbi:MAG: glycosyltransferase family protein [Nitrospiria bacterium]